MKMHDEAKGDSSTELEKRVRERTAALTRSNQALQVELEERMRMERALNEEKRISEAFFISTLTPLVLLDKNFNFIRVNEAYAKSSQRPISEFKGHNHFEFYPHDENEALFRRVVESKVPYLAIEKPFVFPDHPEWGVTYWNWTLTPLLDGQGEVEYLILSLDDVTGYKEIQNRIQTTNVLLNAFVKKFSRKEYLDQVVEFVRTWSGCRCVGIRVLEEDGFIPFESYLGFSQEFWHSENWLSVDHDQCICIRVLKGQTDPLSGEEMTPNGSFCSNNTQMLMNGLTKEERCRYRGVCIQTGFSSLAVIPIRHQDKVLGVIHLADEKEGKLPHRVVEFIESMAPLMGESIYRFQMEEELHRSHETQALVNSLLRHSLGDITLEEFLKWSINQLTTVPWLAYKSMGCIFLLEDDPDVLIMKAQNNLPDTIRKGCAKVPFGTCLCGQAALNPQTQYINCSVIRHEVHDPAMQPHAHYLVPILYGGKRLGLLNLYLNDGHRSNQKEEDFLNTVSHTLASIIVRRRIEDDLRESETRLRNLSSQLLSIQEAERKRVARELHDGIGQMLTAIKFKVEKKLQQSERDALMAAENPLRETLPLIQESIEEVRRIQMDLRPPTLDDLGLLATIAWFCREFKKTYSSFATETLIDAQEKDIPPQLKTVIYRIMQEAFNNSAKHSQASLITLSLKKTKNHLTLEIEDNGLGFDMTPVSPVKKARRGFGLTSMRERAELSGGVFTILSVEGKGTTIRVSWPKEALKHA